MSAKNTKKNAIRVVDQADHLSHGNEIFAKNKLLKCHDTVRSKN